MIKSTFSNILTYYLCLFQIPVRMAKRIEKIQRDFQWGGGGDEFKFHLVNWSKVCMPTEARGLGVRNLIKFNRALLGKWLWRFANEGEARWRKLVGAKHDMMRGGWYSKEVGGPYRVGVWKCIRRWWRGFAHHLRYDIEDGSTVFFWHDVWCGERHLKFVFPELFNIACNKDAWVEEYMEAPNDLLHWNVMFIWPVHDWEIDVVSSFFEVLYS